MSIAQTKPAVFLDRDRTLIDDPGYISDPDQVRLLDGAVESLRLLRGAGYAVVVVTNQSGVARGLLTEGDLAIVHQRMRDLLRAQGSDVDAIYYCPFLDGPEAVREQYRRDSTLRKPKPGMLLLAAEELRLDLERSWMIGDSARDVQAGRAAGCRTILISSDDEVDGTEADHVASDLPAAAEHVLACCPHGEVHGPSGGLLEGVGPVISDAEAGNAVLPERRDRVGECENPGAAGSQQSLSHKELSGQPGPPASRGGKQATGAVPASAARSSETLTSASASHVEDALGGILEELRIMRRERQYEDFSMAKLGGAILEAFALCAAGWGLYAWMTSGAGPDPERATSATIWLLGAIVFQLMAMTCLVASNKK